MDGARFDHLAAVLLLLLLVGFDGSGGGTRRAGQNREGGSIRSHVTWPVNIELAQINSSQSQTNSQVAPRAFPRCTRRRPSALGNRSGTQQAIRHTSHTYTRTTHTHTHPQPRARDNIAANHTRNRQKLATRSNIAVVLVLLGNDDNLFGVIRRRCSNRRRKRLVNKTDTHTLNVRKRESAEAAEDGHEQQATTTTTT